MKRLLRTLLPVVALVGAAALPSQGWSGAALDRQPAGVALVGANQGSGAPEHAAASGFPVTISSDGAKVTIRSRPTRILCLSPSATQMVYAIGAGKQVVGVDMYSTYPPDAPRTKLTGGETDAESYLRFHPDLVLLAFPSGTIVAQLKELGIPTLVLPPATNFAGVDSQITELGEATGHQAAARQVKESLARQVAASVSSARGAGRGRTYYLELSPSFYTATSSTFIGAEFSLFGMRDVANAAGHGTSYPQISAEYLLKENPDYVVLADTVCCRQTVATFASRPGFKALRAVRDHHVIAVNDSDASEWGPHTIEELVAILAHALRP